MKICSLFAGISDESLVNTLEFALDSRAAEDASPMPASWWAVNALRPLGYFNNEGYDAFLSLPRQVREDFMLGLRYIGEGGSLQSLVATGSSTASAQFQVQIGHLASVVPWRLASLVRAHQADFEPLVSEVVWASGRLKNYELPVEIGDVRIDKWFSEHGDWALFDSLCGSRGSEVETVDGIERSDFCILWAAAKGCATSDFSMIPTKTPRLRLLEAAEAAGMDELATLMGRLKTNTVDATTLSNWRNKKLDCLDFEWVAPEFCSRFSKPIRDARGHHSFRNLVESVEINWTESSQHL